MANEHNFSDKFVAFSGDKPSISLLLCETMVVHAAELNHMQDLFCNLYNRICHFECISIVIVRSYAHKEKTILSFKQRFGFTPYATKHYNILCDIWKSVWDHNNVDNKLNIHHVCKFTLVASIWWNTHNVVRKNVFLLCMCICSLVVYWDRTIILPVNSVQNSCNLVHCNQL